MANRLQLRRDGAQQWANVNPILAQGELGIELDTSRLKIGDGVTPWNSLKYERPLETESNTANTLVKRDADGNFEAGAITASIVGNAATATRLANARSFTLTGDMTGSASFDGSANINITAELNYQPGLPHYDANNLSATGTYTQITLDSRGRVTTASNPSTLAGYGITDATPSDPDLIALAAITSLGLLSRTGNGTAVTRQITGATGQIVMTNGSGASGDPQVGLADTPVVVGSYNPTGSISLDQPQLSVSETGSIHQTVNTPDFTVDRYGRLTYAATAPIATATQGTESALWDSGTTYARYGKVKNSNDRLYEAIAPINSGGSEPTHTDTSDTGSWRYLGSALSPQKGLASFNQEDFDVTAWNSAGNYEGGFVTIAQAGVDNTQLQNNRVSFADGNTKEDFELDQELTATTGYRGFNYLNYIKINDTSGNLLVGANNTGDSGAGEIDINVRSYYSDPDITLDGSVDQKLDKTGDGNLTFQLTQSSSSDRTVLINATNSGAGDAKIDITSENDITINATNVSNRVNVEGFQFQDDTLSSTAATMILDPGDDDTATGKVQIRGDLQVDGTTTTVNSTVVTIDDPIIVLGGDTTPVSDDNKDRGVEFSYYDTQARKGFYGWDEDYANANMWSGTGGYRFLYNATNTSEVFTGTDAPIIAGNLRLTTNTGSTWKTPTTGTLVVTGGVGISENLNVGGTSHLNGNVEIDGTVDIDANFAVRSGTTDKFTVASSTGNTVIEGTLDVQLETEITDNLIIKADNKKFDIQTAAGVSVFDVDSDNGNVHTDGTLDVDSGVTFNSTLDVDLATTLNNTLDVDGVSTFHNDIILDTTGKTFKLNNGSADKFVVQSTSGNTDIEGSLNVGSLIHFESTDTPTISTDGSNNYIITGSDYGALRLDGGGYIEGNTLFNSDIFINGQINQKDQGSSNETFNTQNFLRVRYKFRTGVTAAYTPNYAQDNSSNFRSFGGGGIATDLHIGDNLYVGKKASTDNVEFSVSPAGNIVAGRSGLGSASAGTITVHGDAVFNREFSITGAQTTIGDASGDALSVNATSTFNAPVTLSGSNDLEVGGNATIEGNLTVNGTTTTINTVTTQLDDPILTLGGDTAPNTDDNKDRGIEFRYYDGSAKLGFFGWDDSQSRFALYHNATNTSEVFGGTRSGIDAGSIKLFDTTNATSPSTGTLIVGGGAGIGLDLRVGDDLFVVDDADIGGNLNVTGTFDVGDDLAVANNKFNVDAVTGNTTVAGTFGLTGIATLNSTVNIVGSGSNLTVAGTGSISGNFDINSTKFTVAAATGNTVIDGTLDVDEATNVTSTLGVTGITTITNATAQSLSSGSHSAGGAFRLTGGAGIGGNVSIGGSARIYTDLTVDDDLLVKDVTEVQGLLKATNTADSGSATDVGASVRTAGGLAVAKKTFIGDDLNVGAGNFTVDGPTGNTLIAGTLGVTQNTNLSTFTASGIATLQSTLNLGGSLNINSSKFTVASVSGNTNIAGTLDVTNAVDFDSTLNVDGNADFNSGIDVTSGNATFAGLVQADNVTDSTGYTDASASLSTDGGLSVAKKAYVGGDFSVGGAAGIKASILAASGNTDIKGTLNVDDSVTFGGTLGVTGQITGDVTGDLTGNADTATQVAVTETNNNALFYPAFMGGNTGNQSVHVDSANLRYNPFSNTLTVTNFLSTTNFEVQGNMNVTGTITFQESQVGDISNHDTDALTEGSTNLYFTDERVDDRVNNLFTAGTGITKVYDDAANSYTLSVTQVDINTDNVTEGSTNLFTTAARTRTHFVYGTGIQLNTDTISVTQSDINTDNVTEGSTNLFTTNTRTRSHFTYGNGIALSAGGELTVTESQIDTDNVTEGSTNLFTTAARTRTHFTYGTGITHSSGTLSVTQADIDTDNVTEGSSNLFTTAARTRTHFTYGTGIKLTTADLAIDFTEFDTDNVSEGSSNLYFTNARADARIAAADTDDLSEGSTNLYYTNARADARVVAGITGKLDASAISTFGLTLVDDASASAARTTLGLGSAATTASSAYATAAQGTLADSATQPGDLATVATSGAYNDLTGKPTLFSGAYNDLTGKPTLGTAAATASTAYATAAQGTKADANDADIDDIYTQLVAIGNNAAITTVAQLKTALLALARS